jgi:2-polyprenyl-3-methyl-5-hydroxy-6-metoxy-1,4-benzoquinol methylase
LELVHCNLCGSSETRFVYSMPDVHFHRDEWFSIVECASCGLGFVNPRPAYTDMARYYPPEFYQYFDDAKTHVPRYEHEAEFLGEPIGEARLLDIGCANGDFPRFMKKRGWKVEGVEVSSNSRSIDDFPIYQQEFASLPFHDARYDAITAWAVLEHVHDPMAYFKKAAELLKPGGRLIFLVTNFKSVSSRSQEDPPRHLYFFTEDTVKRYLSGVGLRFESAHYDNKIYEMRPVAWLRHLIFKHILRKQFRFEDIPDNRVQFLKRNGLANSFLGNLRYLLSHPFTVFDRLTMPFYERAQMLARTYGVVVYVATRPS